MGNLISNFAITNGAIMNIHVPVSLDKSLSGVCVTEEILGREMWGPRHFLRDGPALPNPSLALGLTLTQKSPREFLPLSSVWGGWTKVLPSCEPHSRFLVKAKFLVPVGDRKRELVTWGSRRVGWCISFCTLNLDLIILWA